MEVGFTLWSLHDILRQIPFDAPVTEKRIALDFSKINAPYYVKTGFRVVFIYNDNTPYEASCSIYSPEKASKVAVVVVIKQKYEKALEKWLASKDDDCLKLCCRRRELYCHEISHLVAIIRAFPSERSSNARADFILRSREKFIKSIGIAEDVKPAPLVSISLEKPGISPSVFDKDHFRYGNDSLNYFKLYQELIFPYDKMVSTIAPLVKIYQETNTVTFDDVAKEALIDRDFFEYFPEKLTAFQKLLAEKLFQ